MFESTYNRKFFVCLFQVDFGLNQEYPLEDLTAVGQQDLQAGQEVEEELLQDRQDDDALGMDQNGHVGLQVSISLYALLARYIDGSSPVPVSTVV